MKEKPFPIDLMTEEEFKNSEIYKYWIVDIFRTVLNSKIESQYIFERLKIIPTFSKDQIIFLSCYK